MDNFLEIDYRPFPTKKEIFKHEYRNDPYTENEYMKEFQYYEETPIQNIKLDDSNYIPLTMFLPEGINYLLPIIIKDIQKGAVDGNIPIMLEEFIVGLSVDRNLQQVFKFIKKSELLVLKKVLENILFGSCNYIIESVGEVYFFRSLEYLENLVMKS